MAEEVVGLLRHVLQLDRSDLAKGFALAGADADAFKRKVDKAMTDAERSLAKPEQAVRRLEAAMRGDRLLQSANNIVAAMNKVGGATKLTEAEQARYNATLSRAVEKYKQLGQEAPKALLAAEAATRKAVPATDALAKGMTDVGTKATLAQRGTAALAGTVGQMAAGFTIATVAMRGIGSLVDLGKEAFATAGALTDMSAKTGLSAETLQRLDFVAGQAGGTLENFTEASYRLGIRLSSGSGAVNKAVEQLGLSMAALRKSSPDKQLELVAQALFRVGNETDRNRLGMELFGRTYSQIAGAVAQNMNEIAKAAPVMADAHVKALDDMADRFDAWLARRKTGFKAFMGEMLAQLDRSERIKALESQGVLSRDEQIDLKVRIMGGEKGLDYLAELEKAASQLEGRDKARVGTAGSALLGTGPGSSKTAVQQLRELDAQLAKLTKSQLNEIAALQALGNESKDIEDQFGLTEGALSRLTATQREGTKATKEAAKDIASFNKELIAMVGTDAIEEAFRALELIDAAAAQGVGLDKLNAKEQERVNKVFKDAIATYERLGIVVPAKILQAFAASRSALSSVMDTSALSSMVLDASGVFHEPSGVGIARDMEIARAARAAFPDSKLDTSGLKDMELAADGTFQSFKDLNQMFDEFARGVQRFESGNRNPMQAWISNVDMLTRSFDQAGLSVSRYTDAALSGLQAGNMMRTGGWQNKAAGVAAGVGSMAAATGSGSRTNRIVGGAISGAMTTAALTGTLAATGAKMGAWGGWAGMAAGAGIGAGIGLWRSKTVGKDEKEARASFEAWQKQVITNFDAIAHQQGRVTDGMTDWEKMVSAVAEAYEATGRTVEDVHHDMKVLSDSTRGSAEDVAAALEHINGVLNEQAQDTEILNGAMAEYGFTLDQAGKKFQDLTQNGQAKKLAEQYRVLLDSGMDPATVIEGMGGAVSKWLQDSMRIGSAIPSMMRPMLDAFARQGELLDENGILMSQAEVAGLNFKDIWADGLDRVAVKLDAVIERLGLVAGIMTGMPVDTLLSAQASIAQNAAPATNKPITALESYRRVFGVETKHKGGIVERAHNGTVVGRHLFGRMASDEMPMILQRGEAVINRMMTNRMGGARTVDALNNGDLFGAASRMVSDPFADMGRLIDMPNRFAGAATMATPPPSGISALAAGGGQPVFNIKVGDINVVAPKPELAGPMVRQAVLDGIHNNTGSFRTTLIRKIGKGQ